MYSLALFDRAVQEPRFKTLTAVFPNTQLVVLCVLDSKDSRRGCLTWDVRLYLARSFWMEGRFIAVLSVIVATLLINIVLIALLQWREMVSPSFHFFFSQSTVHSEISYV